MGSSYDDHKDLIVALEDLQLLGNTLECGLSILLDDIAFCFMKL